MSDITDLYSEIITEHNKKPRNFRTMDGATQTYDAYNPLCGDRYMLYFKVENNVIADVSFEGVGCAISKASASIMTTMVKGRTVDGAVVLFEKFHNFILGKLENTEGLERLSAFSGVSKFPARVKCATLPWHGMKTALETSN